MGEDHTSDDVIWAQTPQIGPATAVPAGSNAGGTDGNDAVGDLAVLLRSVEDDHIPNSRLTAVVGFKLEFIPGLEGRVHAGAGVGYPVLFDWFDWFSWFDWLEAALIRWCHKNPHRSFHPADGLR
jgi:hypothetical protein